MNLKTFIKDSERGTAAVLAQQLGISPSYLSQLASGLAPISPERAVDIERATKGAVTRKDLRPEDWQFIWPELKQERRRAPGRRNTDTKMGRRTRTPKAAQ
jgi:DNA-binding transcriptional regulator YdaS (Cro superfamily)